ncbi:SPASM domain-containing protein [Pseudoalteromonas sp. McH1-42]|uniref:radical SAM/SPASM domain-containing protein n=1 Tax=Pseudoalteromonas sp. McH1-42 TaxID=2917752 RepID=UPI001EF44031|nr:SPASM domain-containing protein [Pseudoalteromonas sp. McH1-42]MCG7562769.1 SPASM domain-containing protein [Pseudoalteromonas sp. McH1-42]
MAIPSPKTLTILPTYRCTAACKECCFESNPNLKSRLTLEEMSSCINEAVSTFPQLENVVFSGGECFTLKDDLFSSISLVSSYGLKSRCVTNGYWAKKESSAMKIAKALSDSGLYEINFSTGLDHQEYVDEKSIINAVKACASFNITPLIMVEKDSEDSRCRASLEENAEIKSLLDNNKLTISSNTWMPFQKDYVDRGFQISPEELETGCNQVFENIVITPHGRVSSCCGLTFEHIKEMKIGHIFENEFLKKAHQSQLEDFLKIWIKVDGPAKIISLLMGDDYAESNIGTVSHNCQACVYLHKDKQIIAKLKQRYAEFLPSVMFRYKAKIRVDSRLEHRSRHGRLL